MVVIFWVSHKEEVIEGHVRVLNFVEAQIFILSDQSFLAESRHDELQQGHRSELE